MHSANLFFVATLALGCAQFRVASPQELVWPRFRGPNGSGVAEGQKPPVEFGPDKNVKWKVSAPNGLSSPIVAGELVVLTGFENGKLYTMAFQQKDGAEVWRKEADTQHLESFHQTEGSPAASTPATDGQRIFSYFGSCGLFCYDLTGRELWHLTLPAVHLGGGFGSGVSPIVTDGLVILVHDEMGKAEILAVNANTGAVQWRKPRLSMTSYCTPVVWDTPKGKQLAAAGHARMTGYDLQSGTELWSVSSVPSACCSSPVIANGNLFFAGGSTGPDDKDMQIPSFDSMLKDLDADKDGALSKAEAEKAIGGFFDNYDSNHDGKLTRDEWDLIAKFLSEGKNAAFALKPGGTGDITGSHVLWIKGKGLPYVATALVYQGQYLMVKDGGIVTAYDALTGRLLFQDRLAAGGNYYASPVAADGHIYFVSTEGAVTVTKAGSDHLEVVAANPKLGERASATPAIASDTLYLRAGKNLFAFATR